MHSGGQYLYGILVVLVSESISPLPEPFEDAALIQGRQGYGSILSGYVVYVRQFCRRELGLPKTGYQLFPVLRSVYPYLSYQLGRHPVRYMWLFPLAVRIAKNGDSRSDTELSPFLFISNLRQCFTG